MTTYLDIILGHRPFECSYEVHLKLAPLLIYLPGLEYMSYNNLHNRQGRPSRLDSALVQAFREPKHCTLYMEHCVRPFQQLLIDWLNEVAISTVAEDQSIIDDLREILATNQEALAKVNRLDIEIKIRERTFEWSRAYQAEEGRASMPFDLDLALQYFADPLTNGL